MSSTNSVPPTAAPANLLPEWRQAGLRWHTYNFALRRRFGQRVHKISLDAGLTCPNVDGTVATGGCVFCDNRSFSPSRRLPRDTILGQLEEGIRRVRRRYSVNQFLAYFQPATNTYAPVERLRPLFHAALEHPQVVGLAIGTRQDCVGPAVVDLLSELAGRTYLSVEFGVQSIHERSLIWMNRGHDHAATVDALTRCRGRGFEICAHVILGLPGETPDDMLATARELVRLRVDAVKLHNLYVVKKTPLAEDYLAGRVELVDRETYVTTLVRFLELLPAECVVERVSGEAPPGYFLAPSWALDKPALRRAIEAEFLRRDTWQGRCHDSGPGGPQPLAGRTNCRIGSS